MIDPIDLHLRMDVAYGQLNSNKKLDVLPEIKDIILNNAVSEFIANILTPFRNPEKLGFESTEVIYSKLQRLISDKKQTVYFGQMYNQIQPSFENEICLLPEPLSNLKEMYYGYTFKPYNQLEFIKGTLKYKGDHCTRPSLTPDEFEIVENNYIIIPLGDIKAKYSLNYKVNFGGTITRDIPLIPIDLAYMQTYTKAYKFQLIKHIIGKVHDVYDLGSPYRLEIAYEKLDNIYQADAIIIKDNTHQYFPDLNLGVVELIDNTNILSPVIVRSYAPIAFPVFRALPGTIVNNNTKVALYSNKTIIDISDNYYYQKNKIREVPIALRNNIYVISNLLPLSIPLDIIYTYIRKPILIDYQLNQGLELEEDVESIINIAVRHMTAYTSNPNSYQISNNEQLKQ